VRRLLAVAAAAWIVLGTAGPAAAHGLGGRADLPVPLWLFVYGAAAVVVVSFVALGVLWKEPRLEDGNGGRPLPEALQRPLTSRLGGWVVRGLSLVAFIVVTAAAAVGVENPGQNIAPMVVFVWFWVGLAFAHALLGNWWATLSPWDTLARILEIGGRPRRPYPAGWGKWPAAILLLGFLWLELVYPDAANPRTLAVAIGVYTVITLFGMAVFGRQAWNRNGEAFAVYFGLLSRLAPVARDREGRVVLRPFLRGLTGLAPQPGLVGFVLVVIGSTTFDGFTGTALWDSWAGGLAPVPAALAGTAGLVGTIGVVAAAYSVSMLGASAVAGIPWHPLAVRFVHSLVPIAFAYVAAHYFSFLVLEGQGVIPLLSDPFGAGWNVVGTAGYDVNLGLISALAVWYVQVAAIVLGHVSGVVLAHDRSLAAFPARKAMRTQHALLGVMVLFTVGGLVILSGG
jgi:hypothetical protein